MLDALAEMQAQRQVLFMDKEAMRDQVLTNEIRQALDSIDAEFDGQEKAVAANIAELESAVKAQVLAHGATVKGAVLQACWTKPREAWDTKALNGYAAAHPEIEKFRKGGEPSVSIRTVK
jgi:hypothetical protein